VRQVIISALIAIALVLISPPMLLPASGGQQAVPSLEKAIKGNDLLIIPGIRVGVIELGQTIEHIEGFIGKGEIVPRKDFQIYSFPEHQIDVSVQKELAVMILVLNPRYKTKEGICVGSSVTPIIRNYGKSYEFEEQKGSDDYIITYWEKGISFSLRKNRIIKIKIFNEKLGMKFLNK
jgi:hypothetical protein